MQTGRDFFPAIDGGQIKLHVRAPAGTRIEATEVVFQAVEDKIREIIPERERDLIVDDIGIPQRLYNLSFTDGSTIGPNDGVILVALKEGHAPTARLRTQAARGATGRISGSDVLLSGCRHGHANPEFRHSGADRRENHWQRSRDQPARSTGTAAAHCCNSWNCRRTSSTGDRRSGIHGRDRSCACPAVRIKPAEYRQ